MVIAAFACFVALLVAWLLAPDEGPPHSAVAELEELEIRPLAA
jgi:hypothetical protein